MMSLVETIHEDWLRQNQDNPRPVSWNRVEPDFTRLVAQYGGDLVLEAVALVETEVPYFTPEDVKRKASHLRDLRNDAMAADPEGYERMKREAADPATPWIVALRQEAIGPFLRGRISRDEFQRRSALIVPEEVRKRADRVYAMEQEARRRLVDQAWTRHRQKKAEAKKGE